MTDEEKALKEIDLLEERGEFSSNIAKTIREALNYRITKKPLHYRQYIVCPNCFSDWITNAYTKSGEDFIYCKECGQKIYFGNEKLQKVDTRLLEMECTNPNDL